MLKKGFGLIETIVAVGLLSVVTASITALGVTTVHGTVIAKHKTEAYFIAQDAMEQIKGARDWVWDNWSESEDANNKITWQKFWDNSGFTGVNANRDFESIKNNLSSKCVYINHGNGDLTEQDCNIPLPSYLMFEREITKEDIIIQNTDEGTGKKVTVSVIWKDYGVERSVFVTSYLTDWKPRY